MNTNTNTNNSDSIHAPTTYHFLANFLEACSIQYTYYEKHRYFRLPFSDKEYLTICLTNEVILINLFQNGKCVCYNVMAENYRDKNRELSRIVSALDAKELVTIMWPRYLEQLAQDTYER